MQLHKTFFQRRYGLQSLLFYIGCFLLFFVTSQGLDTGDYMLRLRQFLLLALFSYCVEIIRRDSLFGKQNIPALFVGCLWSAIIPILNYISYRNIVPNINSSYEILFGAYLFLGLCCLRCALAGRMYQGGKYLYKVIVYFFALPPVVEIFHFIVYRKMLDESSVMAIFQTTLSDWWEWILTYVGMAGLLGFAVAVVVIDNVLFNLNRLLQCEERVKMRRMAVLLSVLSFAYLLINLLPKTTFARSFLDVYNYVKSEKQFSETYASRFGALHIDELAGSKLSRSGSGTILLVIGESACRDNMQAYRPSYPYENTPWLSAQKKNPDFILFSHAYACYNQTAVALSKVLTESSQYNAIKFYEACSIIDVAKKAGYKTYWFTNQGGLSKDNASVTMIAKTADITREPEDIGKRIYDEDILPLLKEINGNKRNFVVLHLMGSHSQYKWRYPPEKALFGGDTREATYANSILYTDSVLKEIYEYGKKNLNMQVMVYFSDHGENLYKGHHPQITTFEQVRIPLFIYLSQEYQNKFSEQAALLKERKDFYFSNDMMYNTLIGIMRAYNNRYDASEDLSFRNYKYGLNSVLAFLGKRHVNEDKE